MGDSADKGIFIHTKGISPTSMLECLQSLHSICPDILFTSVDSDDEFQGFRAHFSQPDVDILLRETYKSTLLKSDISVYPLTTWLIIHDFNPKESNILLRDFRTVVEEKFGDILNQRMINVTENQQALLVVIDIPEMKDLNIFYNNGYPNMEIKLSTLSTTLKVNFWCRHCQQHGHTYQECFESKSKKSNASGKSKGRSNKRNDIEMQVKTKDAPLNLAKPEKNFNVSNYLMPNETFASRIGREQILKAGFFPGDKETLDQLSETDKLNPLDSSFKASRNNFENDNIMPQIQIKQEVSEAVDGYNRRVEGKNYADNQTREMSESNKDSIKEEPDSLADQLNDQETCPFPSDGEDDIQVINYDNTSGSDKFLSPSGSKSFASFGYNEPGRRESSGASEASPQPATGKPLAFSMFSGFTGASSQGKSTRQQPKPSTSQEISSNLSIQLRECFNKAYEKYPVLDRKTLDAFLIHVKKKSNPRRVASNYTGDVEGLKNQLQHILHFYYNTPQTGTKEDIQFIKWLNGLVDRFEGTIPRKRKRTTKDDKESTPTKIAPSSSHD